MKKVLVALVGAVVLGTALPASAHITRFNAKDRGFIVGDGVRISGRIQCTAGEVFVIRVRVVQKEAQTGAETFRGFGTDKGGCTGALQNWTVVTDDNTGTPQEGDANLTANAFTTLGGVQHGKGRRHEEVIFLSH